MISGACQADLGVLVCSVLLKELCGIECIVTVATVLETSGKKLFGHNLERKNRTVMCHAMYGSACQTWEAKMKVLPVYAF